MFLPNKLLKITFGLNYCKSRTIIMLLLLVFMQELSETYILYMQVFITYIYFSLEK